MLYKQELGLAGQETEQKKSGHRVYKTVIIITDLNETRNFSMKQEI